MAIQKEYFLRSKLKMVEMRAEKSHWRDSVIIIRAKMVRQAKKVYRMRTHRRKIHTPMKIQMQKSYLKSSVRAKKQRA